MMIFGPLNVSCFVIVYTCLSEFTVTFYVFIATRLLLSLFYYDFTALQ